MCSCGFCTCNLGQKLNDLQHQDLVMQFLMGLNDSYAQVRAEILLMDPLPSINKVYSLLIQEERHCIVGNNSGPHVESSTLVIELSSSSWNKNNKNSKGKEKPTCNHCAMMGQTVESVTISMATLPASSQRARIPQLYTKSIFKMNTLKRILVLLLLHSHSLRSNVNYSWLCWELRFSQAILLSLIKKITWPTM